VSFTENLKDCADLDSTNYSNVHVQLIESKILSNTISRPAGLSEAASTPTPGPSQKPSTSFDLQSSASSGTSFQIPADLTFTSVHAASFALSASSPCLLDADDETLGLVNMDSGDSESFPTSAEAYRKQPATSDAEAVKKAKKK
jgi:hypothetical protein